MKIIEFNTKNTNRILNRWNIDKNLPNWILLNLYERKLTASVEGVGEELGEHMLLLEGEFPSIKH